MCSELEETLFALLFAWCLTQGYLTRKDGFWVTVCSIPQVLLTCPLPKMSVPWRCCLQTPAWFQSCPTLTANTCSALDQTQHWTKAYSLCYRNMAYIPDPTEKLQVSCSHSVPTPLSKSNPNNTHWSLLSTSKPRRKLKDHTSIWATLNLKRGTYTQS